MMNKIGLLLLLFPLLSSAQNTLFDKPVKRQLDSILAVLKTDNDTLKMSAYRDLHFYYSEMDRDTALYYAEQQLLLSQKLKQKLWEASAYESIGYVTQIQGNYPKAHLALSNALRISEDPESEKGNWNIKRFDKAGNAKKVRYYNITATHILFAFLNIATGNKEKAFESFNKGIKTSEAVNDPVGLIAAYANFGSVCRQFNKLDSAIQLTTKAINYLDASDLKTTNPPYYNFEKGNSLNTMALIYSQKGDFNKAKLYLKEAEALCQDENSRDALVNIYISMADVYKKNKQLDSSLHCALKALGIAQQLGTASAINNTYPAIAEAYKLKGNFSQAFKYLELSKSLNDSINHSRQDKVNQYQTLSFSEQLRLLEVEKENIKLQSRVRSYAMLIGIGVFILIAFILFINNRNRTKANRQLALLNSDLSNKNALLDKRNADNELLLKEIHHRVKNNLEIVSSLLELQSAQIDDPDIQEAMLASQNRVQSMGILHQKLYQSEHLAFIEMKNYFKNLCENILDSYNVANKVIVDLPMNELEMDVDTAVPIGLIVNELLTNSLKYAFPQGKSGRITLSLEDKDDKTYELRIADNGIGKTEGAKPQGTGFGTQLVALLTKQLDGKMEQVVDNGTIISIYFKKSKVA